jgi:hypothetical protein
MRSFLIAAALVAAAAADPIEDVSSIISSATSSIAKPTFTVSQG